MTDMRAILTAPKAQALDNTINFEAHEESGKNGHKSNEP